MSAPIRALVVDDDAAARQRIRQLLAGHPDVVVARECADGREAVQALATLPLDLVLLDVQMPGLDGFGVLAEVGAERVPPVIFVSAYAEFAVRAFEAYALDYLLKPFDEARFAQALGRARQEVERRRAGEREAAGDARVVGLLAHVRRPETPSYPEAMAVRSGDHYVVVRLADVDWIEADGNYARLYVQQRPRVLAKTLAALEQRVLDPDVFVRVHRSAIVNATKIALVEPLAYGELTLVLRDGTRVPCSRRFRKRLEEKLFFTS